MSLDQLVEELPQLEEVEENVVQGGEDWEPGTWVEGWEWPGGNM